ncbi:uncharacterized protein KGF55_004232 [Candida pseudojiufengensis]|uniref:uncharacterized protein n=1 Tax=Candida pseudojiufengensis TaxID=497109 RepID=UPI0022240211|nr:uncharacterized protein KGF55_004232 [Candida pseudojiufengensis]KAI5960965.1 hypothetical protein KGF55_004232 [Candida pseudojiufengensis]
MLSTPRQTIYINNINEKVSLNKLRSSLQLLLQNYNPKRILLQKSLKLKGQAFVTFDNVEDASKAVKELNQKPLFDKNINIEFAKSNSDDVYLTDKNEFNARRQVRREHKIQKKLNESKSKSIKKKTNKKNSTSSKESASANLKSWQNLPPNHVLLLQNINETLNINKTTIENYFGDYAGIEIVRYIKPRNLSFIEFENEELATNCLQSVDLSNLKQNFGDNTIFSYAKK